MTAGRSFLAAFAGDLIDLELGPLPAGLRDRARDWVVERMLGAGDVARTGFVLIGTLLAARVRARTGRSYAALDAERRRAIASRVARTRLPLVADYVRGIRSLAVTYVYEARLEPGA
jgi:hypothetical protein